MRLGIDVRLKNESGVGRYIHNLIKWLEKIDKKNKYVLISPNIRWHSVKEQVVMPYLLRKEKLDLVHFPYFNVPIFYLGKFVVTIHDLTIDHFNTGKASTSSPLIYQTKRLGYRLIMENAVRRAARIIVPSKTTKREILEHYQVASKKVVVIYEGTSDKLKAQACLPARQGSRLKVKTKKLKMLVPKQYFLYVGNAYPHKNLEKLIRAFQEVKSQKSKVKSKIEELKLVLVGKEDFFYKRLKKRVREMGLEKEMVFTGYVSDKELGWLYQHAVALVIPSLMEGFSLPALEAMASGCLILASDIPALREICQEAAIYFDPGNIEELSNRFYKSYTTYKTYKTNKTYIKKGFAQAKKFSWEKMARETLKVYESCFSL